ncbi:MAG: peptide chain release factor N(5)-glutamine methyltransferase [Pseudomonadota bacterium]
MQVREALKLAAKKFKESSTPSLDARLLLAHALNYTQEKLLINYDKELEQDIETRFFEFVARREEQEPIAYILGRQEFYGLEFAVNKHVLIPRPETELIIDILKEDSARKDQNETIDILELGIGSGAVSVCLAKEILTANITAAEVSDQAIEIAQSNISKHKVQNQVKILKSDWYSGLDKGEKYDYIVSNPPYICRSEIYQMSKETIDFEPDLALYADNEGLSSYQAIIQNAKNFLKNDGKLVFEIGYSQKNVILDLLKHAGFENTMVKQDLSGLDRIIIAN